ncbi:MAG: FAD-binding oxidoreductase [Acidimicrobiia bacterium]|nr:FAD-binding oxidoreductase [Acidimicrobiia bacterium]
MARLVGPEQVIVDSSITDSYVRDWTGRFVGSTPAVVRPRATDEVATVLAWCHEHGVAVVPQGGNTGLVGGGVPLEGEVVLSLRGLRSISLPEGDDRRLLAGAGATLADVGDEAARRGRAYAVDLAARATATVGGMVATNAGGLHVLRWGGTRQQLVGVEAVLADGRVLSTLRGLDKDNTGYDLPQLLCGSEGTLAVVTAALVRLRPAVRRRQVCMVGFDSVETAVDAALACCDEVPSLSAVELVLHGGVALVMDEFGLPAPLATPATAYLVIELVRTHGPATTTLSDDDLVAELASVVDRSPGVGDVAVAPSDAAAQRLWQYRELHTDAINRVGVPHKLDVTFPAGALAAAVEELPAVVGAVAPRAQVWMFGHVGDGNLHVNVTGVSAGDEAVDEAVLRYVAERGGSISAEHGIGRAKARWLHLNRSQVELDTFAAIKGALDPHRILNPNVLLR